MVGKAALGGQLAWCKQWEPLCGSYTMWSSAVRHGSAHPEPAENHKEQTRLNSIFSLSHFNSRRVGLRKESQLFWIYLVCFVIFCWSNYPSKEQQVQWHSKQLQYRSSRCVLETPETKFWGLLVTAVFRQPPNLSQLGSKTRKKYGLRSCSENVLSTPGLSLFFFFPHPKFQCCMNEM